MSALLSQPFDDPRRVSTDDAEAWALLHERALRELRWRDYVHSQSEPQATSLTDFIEQWKADVRESYADVIPLHGYSVKAPEEGV